MRSRAKQRSFRPMPEALEGRWPASSLLTATVPSGAPGNPGANDPGPVMVADPTASATTSSSLPKPQAAPGQAPSTSAPPNVASNPTVVGQTVTSTATVSVAPNPAVVGQMVTSTATVSSGAPGDPGGTNPGPVPVADPTAGATTSSSSPAPQAAPGPAPSTSAPPNVDSNPAVVGQTVTSTTTVSSGAPGTPGGTNPGPVVVADPTADATTSSSSPNVQATNTALSVAPNPAVVGQTVTFTATVSSTSTGGTSNSRPQGTVQFKDGSTLLGTGILNGGKTLDQATFSTSSLAQGTHPNLTAQYLGQGNYSGSPLSSPFSLTVNPAQVNSQDVITYHFNSARNGWLSGFLGSPGSANWGKYRQVTVPDGTAVRGAPLVLMNHTLSDGTNHNLILVATSGNHAYAYTEDQLRAGNTTPLWQTNLGTPRTATSQNIPPPVGVSSTGVIDPATNRWYLVADRAPDSGDNGSNGFFEAFALNVNTGTILNRANLSDPQNGAPGRPTFNGNYQNQRGALNLVNGRVYATFATYQVETSNPHYHGWVVSLSASSLASNQVFFPMTTSGPYPVASIPPGSTTATNYLLGGGIWAPGGVSFDGTHFFVATGNVPFSDTPNPIRDNTLYNVRESTYYAQLGQVSGPTHPEDLGDHYIDVTAMSANSSTGALSATDWYAPTNQKFQTEQDYDMSGSSVLVLPTIGGRNMAVVPSKDGRVYLLNRDNLGHSGGHLWVSPSTVFTPGADYPGGSKCAAAYYHSSSGDDYVFVVGDSAPGLVAYRVVGGSDPSLSQVWSGGTLFIGYSPGSPVVTDNGSGTVLVWTATGGGDPGQLLAFNAITGAPVYNSSNVASDAPGATTRFPAVTVTQTSVYLATTSGFAAYGNH